jgi:hypothetical protein
VTGFDANAIGAPGCAAPAAVGTYLIVAGVVTVLAAALWFTFGTAFGLRGRLRRGAVVVLQLGLIYQTASLASRPDPEPVELQVWLSVHNAVLLVWLTLYAAPDLVAALLNHYRRRNRETSGEGHG